jgi:hypothetical protein
MEEKCFVNVQQDMLVLLIMSLIFINYTLIFNKGVFCEITMNLTTIASTTTKSVLTTTTTTTMAIAKFVTWEEFQNAFIASKYPVPTYAKYNSSILNAETEGNITSKRELAMFLAQIILESGGLIYVQEIRCVSHGCPGDYETY